MNKYVIGLLAFGFVLFSTVDGFAGSTEGLIIQYNHPVLRSGDNVLGNLIVQFPVRGHSHGHSHHRHSHHGHGHHGHSGHGKKHRHHHSSHGNHSSGHHSGSGSYHHSHGHGHTHYTHGYEVRLVSQNGGKLVSEDSAELNYTVDFEKPSGYIRSGVTQALYETELSAPHVLLHSTSGPNKTDVAIRTVVKMNIPKAKFMMAGHYQDTIEVHFEEN